MQAEPLEQTPGKDSSFAFEQLEITNSLSVQPLSLSQGKQTAAQQEKDAALRRNYVYYLAQCPFSSEERGVKTLVDAYEVCRI